MSYNGYKNFETWLFMLYFEHDIYGILKEQQEHENEEINYSTVYETVVYILNEVSESIDRIEFGYAFVKDLLNASFEEIDIKEVADTITQQLKEETNRS